ncbi:hypothetical protein PR048_028286 [Dryococelus australis]|uniref:Uncharacterized protein n=1 Tax=Dryococelus australis TaxID=614101 RepID=A0ABQ9GIV4_9NEOP|nr:hypothetical protein PR048_028286 [Dryococelus australis]
MKRGGGALAHHGTVGNRPWLSVHHSYIVEIFFINNASVIAKQHAFGIFFNIPPNGDVPNRETIPGCNNEEKVSSRPLAAWTPDNIRAVRQSIVESPRRSARKHAIAFAQQRMREEFCLNTCNLIRTK